MNRSSAVTLLALCCFGGGDKVLSVAVRPLRGDYEPLAFAAIPLHAPVPVLQVLSPQPVRKYLQKRPPSRFDEDRHGLASQASALIEDYEPYQLDAPYGPYAAAERNPPSGVDEETQAVVVYARPNRDGGYSYRRRPTAASSTSRPKREPIVFRIHKYKITKE